MMWVTIYEPNGKWIFRSKVPDKHAREVSIYVSKLDAIGLRDHNGHISYHEVGWVKIEEDN